MMTQEIEVSEGIHDAGSVTGGLEAGDFEEPKWEDSIIPSDDFSDDVSDSGVGSSSGGHKGIASSYFVFALVGLLASLTAGIAYLKFASPQNNLAKISVTPELSQANNPGATPNLDEFVAASSVQLPSYAPELPELLPKTTTQENLDTNIPGAVSEVRGVEGDGVTSPAPIPGSSSSVEPSQSTALPVEIAEVEQLPVSVLAGIEIAKTQVVLDSHPEKPYSAGSEISQTANPGLVAAADGKDVNSLSPTSDLPLTSVPVTDTARSVQTDVSVTRSGTKQKSSPAISATTDKAVENKERGAQRSVPTGVQNALASSGLSQQDLPRGNQSKQTRPGRADDKVVHQTQTAKTDSQHKPSFLVRSATARSAWIEDTQSPGLLREVNIGDTIPDLGKVQKIEREGSGWIVVGKDFVLR